MSLETELDAARKDVVTDGYDMSIGEISSLYQNGELIINPEFQRYFRWDIGRKTKFIESILLAIPIPPIFVFQRDDGIWELVDGLQRVSTLLQFFGQLKDKSGKLQPSFSLNGTRLLPSLSGFSWKKLPGTQPLSVAHQLDIKRARMRVEILKRESDPTSKYELFQRLNTGGAPLSEQEVRNCTMVMIDPSFSKWITKLAEKSEFRKTIGITENSESRQYDLELILRFLAARNHPYIKGTDVHEYLDDALVRIASKKTFKRTNEANVFSRTFELIYSSLGESAFRRWDGKKFAGQFLLSAFEVIAYGVSANLEEISKLSSPKQKELILKRSKDLWENSTFQKYSGAGVRGTDRMVHLLPLAKTFLKP